MLTSELIPWVPPHSSFCITHLMYWPTRCTEESFLVKLQRISTLALVAHMRDTLIGGLRCLTGHSPMLCLSAQLD